ncbi:MAG: hypothetical protein WDZ28_03525 [Simkaniaceae bacterium]
MKNSPHRRNQVRRKMVRKSQSLDYQKDSETFSLENLKKDFHNKNLDKEKLKKEEKLSQKLHSLEKNMQQKKAKGKKKRSKRQQPGIEIDYATGPAGIHPEGKQWNEVVKIQSRDRSHKLQHKLDHQKKSA